MYYYQRFYRASCALLLSSLTKNGLCPYLYLDYHLHPIYAAFMAAASFQSLPTEETNNSNGAMLQELDLEGEISAPVNLNTDDSSTLDEPIKDTFLRDAKAIGVKFKQIFLPIQSRQELLRDWDLWGPLLICVLMALLMQGRLFALSTILIHCCVFRYCFVHRVIAACYQPFRYFPLGTQSSASSSTDASYPEFADIFIIFWIGSIVVTVNSKLLGGCISFFQCVCVLGYCVLPLAISLVISRVFLLLSLNWKVNLKGLLLPFS